MPQKKSRAARGRGAAFALVACGALFATAAVSWAARPIGGATYQGQATANFVNATDNLEQFTIASNRRSIPHFKYDIPVSCNDGRRIDLFFNSKGEKPIPVKTTGQFGRSYEEGGTLPPEGFGTFDVQITGWFPNSAIARSTVTARFHTGGAGGTVGGRTVNCTGSVKFTARSGLGSAGSSAS